MKNQSIQAPIWLEKDFPPLAAPASVMPEMHELYEQDRVQQLEAELAAAQEALSRMKQESLRIRRTSHPTLSDVEIETAQESISNRLTKQIEQLKRERGELCYQVEAEEEFLINSMQRQLERVQKEKIQLENVLEQEQESLVNKMRNLDTSFEQSSPAKSTVVQQLGGLGAVSRCSSVLSSDPSRESDYQSTISTLQSENFRLLSENIRLSQLLRRHGISTIPGTPSAAIPLRRCDSGLSDQSASRSGSISELRNCFSSRTGFDSEQEDACIGEEICPNISPIRPKPKF